MKPPLLPRFRLLASVVSVLLVLGALLIGWFYFQLRASLPQLDGAATVRGLDAAVTIERDALGVPTVRGTDRADVARALGFLHGQERFFQMDLLRRRAAGEFAELFGSAALPLDRRNRALFLDARAALAAAPEVARILAEELGRDQAWKARTLSDFEAVARQYLPA